MSEADDWAASRKAAKAKARGGEIVLVPRHISSSSSGKLRSAQVGPEERPFVATASAAFTRVSGPRPRNIT